MLDVNKIILFSDIDAIYTKNPKIYRDSKKISYLKGDYQNWKIEIDDSLVSNGGMKSKLDVFKMMSILGIETHLLHKSTLENINIILDVLNLKNLNSNGTHLTSNLKKRFSTYKKWLLTSAIPKSIIIISKKGALALSEKNGISHKTNLYCIGIEKFFGKFNKGDIVSLRDEQFNLIGFGKTSYSFDDLLVNKCQQGKVFIHDDFFIPINNDFFVSREQELIKQHVYNLRFVAGYRVVSNKPKILIDNKKKGQTKSEFLDLIEITKEKSSLIRYEAKQGYKKFGIQIDDWILFRIFLGGEILREEEKTPL
jgi:hypothetical protein